MQQTWDERFKEVVDKEDFCCVLCGKNSLSVVCYFERNPNLEKIEFHIYNVASRTSEVSRTVLEVMTLCEYCRACTTTDHSYYHKMRWGTRKYGNQLDVVILAQGLEV